MSKTTTIPYEDRTVEYLREELRSRELPVSGSKTELVARLTAADADRPVEDLTVDELKDELRDRDLPVSGTKAELVDRLEDAEPAAETRSVRAGECVVDDGTPHTGRAVNGVICSAHAMRYRADGTRRDG